MRKTKFARLIALALTLALAVGSLPAAAFAAEAEPASFEVHSFQIAFEQEGSGEALAAPVTVAEGGWANLPSAVYPEKEPAGKTLAGWKLGSKTFAPGQAVSFDQLDMMVLEGELAYSGGADGHLMATAYAVFEDAAPEPEPSPAVKAAYTVIFRDETDGTQGDLAAPVAMERGGWANLPGEVYPEKKPAGKELTGWKLGREVFAPGEKLEADRLAIMWIAGEIEGDRDADGHVTFTAYAVFEGEGPAPVELTSFAVAFAAEGDGRQEALADPLVVEKDGWVSLPSAVYPGQEPAGKKLAGWKLGGSVFAPGAKVEFDRLAVMAQAGELAYQADASGRAAVTAYAVFENAAPDPVELTCISLAFVEDRDGGQVQIAAAISVEKGGTALLPQTLAAGYAPAGKELAGWKPDGSSQVYKPGQKVAFEELAALVGGSYTGEGIAYLAFRPVFEEVKTPAEPSDPQKPETPADPGQPDESPAAPAAKPGAAAVSTGKILPKTGVSSSVAVGTAAVLFAAVCGAGIYLYILRRKEGSRKNR